MRRPLIAWITFGLLSTACGCVLGNGPSASSEPNKPTNDDAHAADPAKGARVAPDWQRKMLKAFASDANATDAWGLFSEGGWGDAGQIMIYGKADKARVQIVNPTKKDISSERALTSDEAKNIAAKMQEADKLSDVDIQSFDGIIYEYVHATKDGTNVSVAKRVFVRNPGTSKAPKHDEMIAVFQGLRKK